MVIINNTFIKKILIQTDNRKIFSWDFLTSGYILNKSGWNLIFDFLLSLPNEAFKLPKSWRTMLCSFGREYSFIKLNKDYLKDKTKRGNLIKNIKKIFSDENNLIKVDILDNPPKEDEFIVHETFKEKIELLGDKFLYWIKKYKENPGYNRFKILERDEFKCKLCGRSPPEVILHIDHWIPKSKGGLDIYENLITLCSTCNQSKHTQIPKNKIEDIL